MKTQKIKFGSEYAIKMRTQFAEKTIPSKKVYSNKDRKLNKIKL